ncbi:hypothetical protein KPC83_00935 [Collinsella sp. zg1085]|uniref:hypothetical protein n=1 Tax=Collinsella sp. zg1085 TaxID=2844380 RepID=UPI001C0D422A|nr:hypothetical protein [Collinsella sp. zg1085]QWT17760.1 hypothetical protein KPC83_00935 [Collinsella sp. zg1085]
MSQLQRGFRITAFLMICGAADFIISALVLASSGENLQPLQAALLWSLSLLELMLGVFAAKVSANPTWLPRLLSLLVVSLLFNVAHVIVAVQYGQLLVAAAMNALIVVAMALLVRLMRTQLALATHEEAPEFVEEAVVEAETDTTL